MNVRRVLTLLLLAIIAVILPGSASASITPTPETRIGNFELHEPAFIGFAVSRTVANHRAKSILCADRASQHSLRWKGMWRFDLGRGVEVYDARARMWSPKLGTFLSVDEFAFHDQNSTLWGWGGQNPIRWSDPFGRSVVSYAHQAELLDGQQNDLFGASAFFATQTADAWASGSYGAAAFDASVTAATGFGGAFVSLLPRHPESADFATLGCPIEAGARPPNLSPAGAGRSGAFRAAKEASGIPRSQQPSRVLPNTNKSGVPQPGRSYEFEVPGGGVIFPRRGGGRSSTFGSKYDPAIQEMGEYLWGFGASRP